MTHEEVQEHVALDERTDEVQAHLATCAICRNIDDNLALVGRLAGALAPQPPSDLADRVLARLEDEPAAASIVRPVSPWRRSLSVASRSNSVRWMSAAAVAVLVLAGLQVLRSPTETPSETVLASARRTAAAGTAKIDVEARTDFELPAGSSPRPGQRPRDPNFSHAPAELRPVLRRSWNRSLRQFERAMATFFEQVDDTLNESGEQLDESLQEMAEQFEDMFGGSGSRPRGGERATQPERREDGTPRTGEERTPQPPRPPSGVTTSVVVRGAGSVDFANDAARVDGRVRTAGGTAPFGVAAKADAQAYLDPRGQWVLAPGVEGTLGPLLLDADAVVNVAAAVGEDAAHVGAVTLDGETVQEYRFEAAGAALGMTGPSAKARWDVGVFIGDDGMIRGVDVASRGETGGSLQARTHVQMRLSGIGAGDRPTTPVTRGRATAPTGSSLLLYPLGSSVDAAARNRRTP